MSSGRWLPDRPTEHLGVVVPRLRSLGRPHRGALAHARAAPGADDACGDAVPRRSGDAPALGSRTRHERSGVSAHPSQRGLRHAIGPDTASAAADSVRPGRSAVGSTAGFERQSDFAVSTRLGVTACFRDDVSVRLRFGPPRGLRLDCTVRLRGCGSIRLGISGAVRPRLRRTLIFVERRPIAESDRHGIHARVVGGGPLFRGSVGTSAVCVRRAIPRRVGRPGQAVRPEEGHRRRRHQRSLGPRHRRRAHRRHPGQRSDVRPGSGRREIP